MQTNTKYRFPKSVALEVTYSCNHQCIFCSCPWDRVQDCVYPREPECTLTEFKENLDYLVDGGVEGVTITGGEPLLRPDILAMLDYVGSKSEIKHRRLISNSTAMTGGVLDNLVKNNFALSLSMPGLETYREHTGASGYENVLFWISAAHRRGLNVTANITVTQHNIAELFETMSSALLAGSDSILLNRFLPGGRGLTHQWELELSVEQINEMFDTAEDVLSAAGRYGALGTEIPKCVLKNPERYQYFSYGTICAAGKDFFVVDPSGYIRPCNHSEHRCSKVKDFVGDEYWERFRTRSYIPLGCINCSDVDYCDGGCREAAHICSGCLDGTDPSL